MKITTTQVAANQINLDIKCDLGRPIVRSNTLGMFCDQNNCHCEQEARKCERIAMKLVNDILSGKRI